MRKALVHTRVLGKAEIQCIDDNAVIVGALLFIFASSSERGPTCRSIPVLAALVLKLNGAQKILENL
jgi:hypothetical protein